MSRWWSVSALFVAPALLHVGAGSAAASIQTNISIIMTTLGTDGTSITIDTKTSPSSTTSVSSDAINGTANVTMTSNAAQPANGNSGSGSGGNIPVANTPEKPAGGTSVDPGSDSSPIPPLTSEIPIDSEPTNTDGPTPPPIPVLDPNPGTGTPPPGDTIPKNEPPLVSDSDPSSELDTGVSDAPEPGTMTLMAFGLVGGYRYFRRSKKSA